MRYMCLVYGDEARMNALPAEKLRQCAADSIAYDKVLEQGGHLVVAHALDSSGHTMRLETRGGQVVSTDGPFAESKEQLLGFLLIEAKDREQAVALAAKVPSLAIGMGVEVRPIYRLEGE